jgi:hypothetical protein
VDGVALQWSLECKIERETPHSADPGQIEAILPFTFPTTLSTPKDIIAVKAF